MITPPFPSFFHMYKVHYDSSRGPFTLVNLYTVPVPVPMSRDIVARVAFAHVTMPLYVHQRSRHYDKTRPFWGYFGYISPFIHTLRAILLHFYIS